MYFFFTGEHDNLLVREMDSVTVKCFYGSDSLKFKCTKIDRNNFSGSRSLASAKSSTVKSNSDQTTCRPVELPHHYQHSSAINSLTNTIKYVPSTIPSSTRQSNVLVEPIQQSCSFYNGNYGELEFGCGIQDVVRLRHCSGDSGEEHAHLESQCIEIIESVINGESPPSGQNYLNGNCQTNNMTPFNLLQNNTVTSSSSSAMLFGIPTSVSLEDQDVSLASASIQNLSMGSSKSSSPVLLPSPSSDSSTSSSSSTSESQISSTTTDCQDNNNQQTYYLSHEDLWKLNDLNYNRSICMALQQISDKMKKSRHHYKCKLLTIPSGVPVLGLQALKLDMAEVCFMDSDIHQPLIHAIAAANDIPSSKLYFANTEDMESLEREWDVLIAEIIDESGCLQQRILEDIALTR